MDKNDKETVNLTRVAKPARGYVGGHLACPRPLIKQICPTSLTMLSAGAAVALDLAPYAYAAMLPQSTTQSPNSYHKIRIFSIGLLWFLKLTIAEALPLLPSLHHSLVSVKYSE